MRSNRRRRYADVCEALGESGGPSRIAPGSDGGPCALPVPARLAPAKVNLGLHVLRRRPDGFHDLATVFLPIGWADRLSAGPARRLAFSSDDPHLPTGASNLVVRAAMALRLWMGDSARGATLRLEKNVPYGAGLGGGSSDAAAALRLLAELWAVDIPEADLHALALGLGSDVPFFLDGVPAHGTGRGERLAPLVGTDGAPYRCPFWLVVAVPPVHVSTADAFARVTPADHRRPDLAAAVASNDLSRWRVEVTNDFQASVEAAEPTIGRTREALLAEGAGHAVLSGTGSAVVGVFEQEDVARTAKRRLGKTCRVWVEAPAS